MSDLKRRSHMISLRISESEYRTLLQSYRNHGARSLSDFARLALQRILDNPASFADPALALKMKEFDLRLEALETRVATLLERP